MRAEKFAALAGLAVACLSPQPVCALDAVTVEGGGGDDGIKRYGMALQWDWGVQWLRLGDWHLGGYWELSASYWDGDDGRTGNDSLGDFGLTPVFRWQTQSPIYGVMPYLEAAVGVHGMTDTEIGDKNFGTEFAFGSLGGAGIRFGHEGQYEIGYRYQHLSNAGIADSNPGINFHLVRLSYHF